MKAIWIVVLIFIFGASFATTHASPVYRWTDNDGTTHFSQLLPPNTCTTESCRQILDPLESKILAREELQAEKQREALEKARAEKELQEKQEERRRAWLEQKESPEFQRMMAEREREKTFKRTHLLKGTVVCDSLSAKEQYFRGGRELMGQLLRDERCITLPADVKYSVTGKTVKITYKGLQNSSSYVPVRIFFGDQSVDIWVHWAQVPIEMQW